MIQLEKAKIEQIDELVRMSKEAFDSDIEIGAKSAGGPPEYDNTNWHIQMMREGHLLAAIESDQLVGGAIVFITKENELYIGRIFIDPKYHRNGYGIELMKKIEESYHHYGSYNLDTPTWNVRTNTFYQKLGYTQVSRDKDFVVYKKSAN